MEFLKRHKGKLVASLLITVGIWLTLRKGGLKVVPESGDFGQVKWWVLPAYAGTLLAMTWFRSVRWRFLLRGIADIPKKRLFAVSCIGFVAILAMPFRLGEFVRPYMIRSAPDPRRPDVKPITMTAATSSIVAERVIDGLYLSIVLALALVLVPTVHPLPEKVVGLPISVAQVRYWGFLMLGVFCVAFATIAVFYFARSWAHKATLAVFGKVSMPLAEKLAGMAEKLADGLHVFGKGGNFAGFMFESTLYWGLNVLGMWMMAWGSGVVHADGSPITFGESCSLMGMLGVTILIPGPPGMLGVFQAGIYAGMTMYFPTNIVTGPGAAYVFLLYATQVVFQLLAGGAGLIMERGGIKALEQADRLEAVSPQV